MRHVLDDFRGAPPAGILLFTDGVNTEGLPLADAAQEARQKGVPILAVGLGRDDPPRDIELADVLVDDAVFVDDLVSFQIQIKADGLEGQPPKSFCAATLPQVPLALPVSWPSKMFRCRRQDKR